MILREIDKALHRTDLILCSFVITKKQNERKAYFWFRKHLVGLQADINLIFLYSLRASEINLLVLFLSQNAVIKAEIFVAC